MRNGTWKGGDGGTRARYLCTPAVGDAHQFSVIASTDGMSALPVLSPCPPCPDELHKGSAVVRDGVYARGENKGRQRYRCTPVEPEGWKRPEDYDEFLWPWRAGGKPFGKHRFTPPIARAHVHRGHDECSACRELTDVHKGALAASRRHRWDLHIVAQALIKLATGTPYSEVSRWARKLMDGPDKEPRWPSLDAFEDPSTGEDEEAPVQKGVILERVRVVPDGTPGAVTTDIWATDPAKNNKPCRKRTAKQVIAQAKRAAGAKRRRKAVQMPTGRTVIVERSEQPGADEDERPLYSSRSKRKNPKSAEAQNAWHQGADWVEVFSPVLWNPWHENLVEQSIEHRRKLDARRAKGLDVPRPQVLLLDAKTVYDKARDGAKPTHRFHILIAAEVLWRQENKSKRWFRDIRLRLARALPTNDHHAWKLLLDELGYEPEYVVSDGGTGLTKAVREHLAERTVLIPSLYHLRNSVLSAVFDTPGAFLTHGGPKTPIGELDRFIDELTVGGHALSSEEAWTAWWDELIARVNALGLLADRFLGSRLENEDVYAAALPHLLANRNLPTTTGGLETLINKRIDPLLAGRGHAFTNIERTNRLLDLVVLYDNDQLADIHTVADKLATDSTATQGWAAPVRYINDTAGSAPSGTHAKAKTDDRYKSLLDQTLPKTLAKARGLK